MSDGVPLPSIFRPLESRLRQLRPAEVPKVQTRSATVVAPATSLLRWPDRDQARRYLEGFPLLGAVLGRGILRLLPQTYTERGGDLRTEFFGPPAVG